MNTTKRRLKKSVSDFLLRTLIVGVITLISILKIYIKLMKNLIVKLFLVVNMHTIK